jgi:hemerythrin-like domain-containing protein
VEFSVSVDGFRSTSAKQATRVDEKTWDPIDELLLEHGLHRRTLAVLERIAQSVERGGTFPRADIARVLGYLREFIEEVHHCKEDQVVYPLVLELGDDDVAEEVGRLLADHDATRDLLASLTMFAESSDPQEQERDGFCQMVRAYVLRMKRHMNLEERHLFPAVRKLNDEQLAEIARGCADAARGQRDASQWASDIAELEEHWIG